MLLKASTVTPVTCGNCKIVLTTANAGSVDADDGCHLDREICMDCEDRELDQRFNVGDVVEAPVYTGEEGIDTFPGTVAALTQTTVTVDLGDGWTLDFNRDDQLVRFPISHASKAT